MIQKTKTKMNKKAQEEIVGFVLIIVLVSVIFLVFLGIFIRQSKPDTGYQSKEYSQFLSSMMEVTSDCVVYSPAYAQVSDLIGYCLDSQLCSDGSSSCSALNSTIQGILDSAIQYGSDRKIKGYEFSVIYDDNSTQTKNSVINIEKGVCNSSLTGADYPLPHYPGIITTTIKVCY